MSSYVPAELRRRVARRAAFLCEYCLIAEVDTFFGCEVDHIISEKHGGETVSENLAYACTFCNRYKGSDIGSIDWESGALVRFFNPREDTWSDHFSLDGMEFRGRSRIGRVTIQIFKLNSGSRIMEREELHASGRYPSEAALSRMS